MHTWWSMKDQLEKEDENTRKSEEKKREEEDKKKREEERKKEEDKKMVGAGPLRLEADRGRAAGRGDCGGSRRQRGTVHQELAGKTLRLSRTRNEYSKT